MTTIRYRGRKGEVVIASPSSPSSSAATSLTRINEQNLRKKLRQSVQKRAQPAINIGERVKEIKRDNTPGQDRVERLAALARERGLEFIKKEIAVHERKVADLRAALKLTSEEQDG